MKNQTNNVNKPFEQIHVDLGFEFFKKRFIKDFCVEVTGKKGNDILVTIEEEDYCIYNGKKMTYSEVKNLLK